MNNVPTDNATLNGVVAGAGSIVSWIKVDNDSEWNNITETAGFSGDNGIELQTNGASGAFGATSGWAAGGNIFGPGAASGTETPTGVWTHIAMTWDAAGDSRVYVNGTAGASTARAVAGNTAGDWFIGLSGGVTGDRDLNGELADFAIYDIELSSSQISGIMQNGVVPIPEPATASLLLLASVGFLCRSVRRRNR